MRNWHLEKRKISELQEHPRNARFISKKDMQQLERSIKKFGIIDKPIISKSGLIIGGHQRLIVLRDLNIDEVECWVHDGEEISNEEIDELNIRLNRNTGQWDWDKLANEWDVNLLCEWGFKCEDFDDPLPKQSRPKVILEFEDSDSLNNAMDFINEIAVQSGAKMKVKVKK
jgi:hypothetical protein